MAGELLASKIVVVEEEPRVRGIPSLSTSDAAAVGITERGPIDQAVLCTSFEEYERVFGGFTANADVPLAAMGFFENGGARLWVVRTVHHTDITTPESATAVRASGYLVASGGSTPASVLGAAFPLFLQDGASLVVSVNGGPDQQATFTGTAAAVTGSNGPYVLADGQTLRVRFDGGPTQEVVFAASDFVNIASATIAEVVGVLNTALVHGKAINADGALRLASDSEGSASRVEVVGGTAADAFALEGATMVGSGNVANVRAVTLSEAQALVEGAIAGVIVGVAPGDLLQLRTVTAGPSARLDIRATTASGFGLAAGTYTGSASGAENALRVEGKDPGAYANRIEVEVRGPSSGEVGAFDVAVIVDGVYRETFPNLRMLPTAERYAERVLNDARTGSALIRVTDQLLAGSPALSVQVVALTGGNDGLVGLSDNDFIGSALGQTGMRALDRVQDLSLLLVPGRATPAVHNAMLRYCEVERSGTLFAILDPPANQSATEIVTYVEATAALLNTSEYGAIYWPWLKVLNPARSVYGNVDTVVVPPSGIVAGVYARTDAAHPGGVYDPPAGIEAGRMFGVLGFETDEVLEERKRDLVYPKRINPLTTDAGLPRYIDGSRTLKGNGNFPYVAERRGVIFIERSLRQGLQFARHKNNTEGLRAQVRRTITAFLLTQMNNGAFRSREPAKAFFVDVSEQLNTPSVIFAGKLIARVGLATNKPAEFIVIQISQDTRALEAELAAAGG